MAEPTYYQSVYTGKQIDDSLGRIVNGELDKAVDAAGASAEAAEASATKAAASATSASADAKKTGADRLVVEGAADAERGRVTAEDGRVLAEQKRTTAERERVDAEAERITAEKSRVTAEEARIAADAGRMQKSVYDPTGKDQDVFAYAAAKAAEAAQELKDNPVLTSGITLVRTYTPKGGEDGVSYAADIPGVERVYEGLTIAVVPHVSCVDGGYVDFDLNAISMAQVCSLTGCGDNGWCVVPRVFQADVPCVLKFSEYWWCWIAVDTRLIGADDIMGALWPDKGGLGRTSIPCGCYLVGNSAVETGMVNAKTPAEVAADIAPHLPFGPPVYTTYTPKGGLDGVDYAVDIPGLIELYDGMMITIISHADPIEECITLSINGLPGIEVSSPSPGGDLYYSIARGTFLKDSAYELQYFQVGPSWCAVNSAIICFNDIKGSACVSQGGTGLVSVPFGHFLMGGLLPESALMSVVPEDARKHMGASKITEVPIALPATGWTGVGPYELVVTAGGITGSGSISPAAGMTGVQRAASRAAMISVLSYDVQAGTVTLVADGEKPAVDIPAVLTIIS